MRYLVVASLVLCGLAAEAHADKAINYGAGVSSCGEWLADANKELDRMYDTSWLLGWVSAAGFYDVRGDLRHTDAAAMSAWVDNYCHAYPLNNIADAAAALIKALAKQPG